MSAPAEPAEHADRAGTPDSDPVPADTERSPLAGRSARRQNIIAALIPLAVGACGVAGSFGLGVGDFASPGPGLWPLIVSIAIVVLSAVLVVESRPTGTEEAFNRGTLTVAVAVASLAGFVALFERIGFEIPAVALLVLWLKVLGREPWRITVAVALCATAGIYLLFIVALGVSLPHLVHF